MFKGILLLAACFLIFVDARTFSRLFWNEDDSLQNFKRQPNYTPPEICTLQNNGKRIEVPVIFTFENKKHQYDTNVYDNAQCKLNHFANDARCKLVYVSTGSQNFIVGCKAEKF